MDTSESAFTFASDLAKQLITLATGVIALTITFLKDVLDWNAGSTTRALAHSWLLWTGWIAMFVSLASGLVMLMALTGELEPSAPLGRLPSIRGRNVTRPSVIQIVTFVLGVGLIVMFAALNL